MYYVYILKNCAKNTLYVGYTNDLRRRIDEHKEKEPQLIYYEAYRSRADARERELKLKNHGQTIRRLKERIKNSIT